MTILPKHLLSFTIVFFYCTTSFSQFKIGSLDFSSCRKAGYDSALFCSKYSVFENNELNSGKKIDLAVWVLSAYSQAAKKDPVFIIMGGPGQAASDNIPFFADIMKPLRENRDIVFIDQRGTGGSNPLKLTLNRVSLQDILSDELMNDSLLRENFARLSSGNLRFYTTFNAVKDIEEVRKAMGYGKINIYGTSYGSRVAMVYAAMYANSVRSVVIKGVVSPGIIIPLTFAKDAQDGMDMVLKSCENDPSCHEAFPNLRNEFTDILSRFGSKGLFVKTVNPLSKKPDSAYLPKGILAVYLRTTLMTPGSESELPYLLHQAYLRNYEPILRKIIGTQIGYDRLLYSGMSLCSICYEDYPYFTKTNTQGNANTFLENYWISRITNACSIWNKEKIKAPKITFRKMETPALIISGGRDGVTPKKNGDEAKEYFTKASHIIIPNGAHSFEGMGNCVDKIICEFIEKGDSKDLDTNCTSAISFPAFKVK